MNHSLGEMLLGDRRGMKALEEFFFLLCHVEGDGR
jgi:hypothetical protein